MSGDMVTQEPDFTLPGKQLFEGLKFSIIGLCDELESEYQVIVEKLGAISGTDDDSSYNFCTSNYFEKLPEKSDKFYNITYICDCILQQKLLDIDDYRLLPLKTPCFGSRYILNAPCYQFFYDSISTSNDLEFRAENITKHQTDENTGGFLCDVKQERLNQSNLTSRNLNIKSSPNTSIQEPNLDNNLVFMEVDEPPTKQTTLFGSVREPNSNSHINLDNNLVSMELDESLKKQITRNKNIPRSNTRSSGASFKTAIGNSQPSPQQNSNSEDRPSAKIANHTIDISPSSPEIIFDSQSDEGQDRSYSAEIGRDSPVLKITSAGIQEQTTSKGIAKSVSQEAQIETVEVSSCSLTENDDVSSSNSTSSTSLLIKNWKRIPKLKKISRNFKLESDSEDSSEDEEDGRYMSMKYFTEKNPPCKIRNCSFARIKHDLHAQKHRNFSRFEHEIIIKYLVKNHRIQSCKGNQVFEDMHNDGFLLHRPVFSLQNTIRKQIMKKLCKFNLPPHIKLQFEIQA